MKRLLSSWTLLCVLFQLWAQIPAGYYEFATGTHGSGLKTALFSIITEHTERSYKELWTDMQKTDVREDGRVWDMYSSSSDFIFIDDQCGTYKKEEDCYNREHSFPKSWFNDDYPMYTDLFHLYPTDGYVNNQRGNYPFGETNGEKYKSNGGFSKLGKSTVSGYSDIVFEPADEYKGDFGTLLFLYGHLLRKPDSHLEQRHAGRQKLSGFCPMGTRHAAALGCGRPCQRKRNSP